MRSAIGLTAIVAAGNNSGSIDRSVGKTEFASRSRCPKIGTIRAERIREFGLMSKPPPSVQLPRTECDVLRGGTLNVRYSVWDFMLSHRSRLSHPPSSSCRSPQSHLNSLSGLGQLVVRLIRR